MGGLSGFIKSGYYPGGRTQPQSARSGGGQDALSVIERIKNARIQRAQADAELKAHEDKMKLLKMLPVEKQQQIIFGLDPVKEEKARVYGAVADVMARARHKEEAPNVPADPLAELGDLGENTAPPAGMTVPTAPVSVAQQMAQNRMIGRQEDAFIANTPELYQEMLDAGIANPAGLLKEMGIPILGEIEAKTAGDRIMHVDKASGRIYGYSPRSRIEARNYMDMNTGQIKQGYYDAGLDKWRPGSGPTGGSPRDVVVQRGRSLGAGDAAKMGLMSESAKAIDDFLALAKPEGKWSKKVLQAMSPLGGRELPVIGGRAVPGPIAGALNMDRNGEIAYGHFLRAVEGKVRPESGAAVPPEEIVRLMERYLPKWWYLDAEDGDKALDKQMDALKVFLNTTQRMVDPEEFLKAPDERKYYAVNPITKEREYYILDLPEAKKSSDLASDLEKEYF